MLYSVKTHDVDGVKSMKCLNRNSDTPTWNIGYTTRDHLCLDLDNTSYYDVTRLVKLIMHSYPETGDAIILLSSKGKYAAKMNYRPTGEKVFLVKRNCYHAIFNNIIPYERSCQIIETLAELDAIPRDMVRIRTMRNDMTTRVSKTVNCYFTKSKPDLLCYVHNGYTKIRGFGIELFMALFMACR